MTKKLIEKGSGFKLIDFLINDNSISSNIFRNLRNQKFVADSIITRENNMMYEKILRISTIARFKLCFKPPGTAEC